MDKAASYSCRDPGLDFTRFQTGALNATNGHMGTFLRRDCVAFRLGTFVLVLLYCDPKAIAQMWKPLVARVGEERKTKTKKKIQRFQFPDKQGARERGL